MAPSPHAAHDEQRVTLPSIASFTRGIHDKEGSPGHAHPQFDPARDSGMTRDSGNWSMSVQSKHSSTISSNPSLHLNTILNNDDGNNRFSTASSIGTSSSSRFPSNQQNVVLPHLSQPFSNQNRDSVSVDANSTSFLDSRRSSVDSRVTNHMGHLQLGNGPGSPYESANASQASLASSLQQQRGIHTPIQPKLGGPTAMSPGRRLLGRGSGPIPPRRAPPIISNPRSSNMPNPMASTPTKGYAWAFPGEDLKDEDDEDESASPESSRQNSLAASSIDGTYGLQHKNISGLQSADHSQIGTGNYSRTPELRVSHKLAERKRRSEMKDLFDSLNKILPNSPGNKSSKWETLSKAIEHIQHLKHICDHNSRENDKLRLELERARTAIEENAIMTNEITAMYQQLLRVDPNGHHMFGPKTQLLEEQRSQTPGQRLPPPVHQSQSSNGWNHSSSGAMQGVEYGHSAYDRR